MIRVSNRQRSHALDSGALQTFAEHALELCRETKRRGEPGLLSLARIDVLLISDRRMTSLHQQFMNIAEPTDVLTFQHGEIFISVDTAFANAEQFQTSLLHEVRLYLVHGLLHLHGYDDTSAAGAKRMQSLQERVLAAAVARLV